MSTPLVAGEYFMNRWPNQDTIFTRGNLKDMAPHALTPLTEHLFCRHETAGSIQFYNDELGLGMDSEHIDTWVSGYFGHIFVNLHCVGGVGDRLPGSSARDIYQAYFGLVADPTWTPPTDDGSDEAAEARRGEEFLAMVSARAMSLDQRVAQQNDLVRSMRRSGDVSDTEAERWFAELCDQLTTSFALLIEAATDASLFFTVIGTMLTQLDASLDGDVVNGLHVDLHDIGSAGSGVAANAIARAISANPEVAGALDDGAGFDEIRRIAPTIGELVDDFVSRFGHRGPGEIELAKRTWRSDVDGLLTWCSKLRVHDAGEATGDSAATALRLDAERRLSAVVGEVDPSGPIGGLLALSRGAMKSRENSKDPLLYNLDEIRRAIDVIGPRLVAAGALGAPDDVFLLTSDEVRSAIAGRAPDAGELERRRAQFDVVREMTVPDIVTATPQGQLVATDPRFFLDQGLFPPSDPDSSVERGNDVAGIGVSPGSTTGRLRLMHDPFDDFEAGDVLVACTVDPGWAPALAAASAVVLELGGPLSHGAVVARELGIPCVVNAAGALASLVDGATATVDGSAGTVVMAG